MESLYPSQLCDYYIQDRFPFSVQNALLHQHASEELQEVTEPSHFRVFSCFLSLKFISTHLFILCHYYSDFATKSIYFEEALKTNAMCAIWFSPVSKATTLEYHHIDQILYSSYEYFWKQDKSQKLSPRTLIIAYSSNSPDSQELLSGRSVHLQTQGLLLWSWALLFLPNLPTTDRRYCGHQKHFREVSRVFFHPTLSHCSPAVPPTNVRDWSLISYCKLSLLQFLDLISGCKKQYFKHTVTYKHYAVVQLQCTLGQKPKRAQVMALQQWLFLTAFYQLLIHPDCYKKQPQGHVVQPRLGL